MGGLSVIVLMNILLFLYIFFITIFVAIILYIVISYTFEGILKNAVHFYEKTTSVENFEEEKITLGNYQ